MKKVLFALVAVAAISLASCGEKAKTEAPVDSVAVDTAAQETVDTVEVDSLTEAPADSVK